MLSKRIVAISSDKAFSRRMAAGLMAAGGTVETVAGPDDLARGEITADLVAVHVTEGAPYFVPAVAQRLKKDAALVVIIAATSLEKVVEAMKVPRVSVVMVADQLTPASLSAVASRLLYGDVFGLEKIVPWGVKVYSQLVGDYQEKSVAIAAVSDFATAMGVRRKYRESVEQCLDEMLMNALYDAPIDSAGKQMFADIPTKTRISLRMEQKAVVQYACDGDLFALSVRDSFGALKGETVVKYLDKCLHAEQQIDRKAGGAGLGLYIISSASTRFLMNLYPGVATEAICTFDLNAAKVQLKEFGIFQERIDSSGRLAAGPSRLMTATGGANPNGAAAAGPSRGLLAGLAAAIVLLFGLIAVVAWPRLAGPKSRGAIAVTTTPPGATIELDGRAVGKSGTTALPVGDLVVGQKYKITARLDGFTPTEAIVEPSRDSGTPAAVSLTLQALAPTVVIESDPSGALVIVGDVEHGQTPLTMRDLAPLSDVQVTLRRAGYGDEQLTVHVPAPGKELLVSRALAVAEKFGALRIESEPAGAEVYEDDHLVAGKTTPIAEEIVVADKPIRLVLRLAGYQPFVREVKVARGEQQTVSAKLEPGGTLVVTSNLPEARWTVDGVKACSDLASGAMCPLPDGKYKVYLRSQRPWAAELFVVEIRGNEVTRDLKLGIVEVDDADLEMQFPGAPSRTRSAAFQAGRHTVTVRNTKTNESAKRAFVITADARVRVGL